MIDGYEMARSPRVDGVLAKAAVYEPSLPGPIVYFAVDDIEEMFRRAEANGGRRRLYPKTAVGGQFVGRLRTVRGTGLR